MGIAPHVQSELPRAPHARRGTKLSRTSEAGKQHHEESDGKVQGGRKKAAMILLECTGDFARRYDREIIVKGDLRQKWDRTMR